MDTAANSEYERSEEHLSIDCVLYNDLSQHLGHDIKFLSVNVCGLYSKQLNTGFNMS